MKSIIPPFKPISILSLFFRGLTWTLANNENKIYLTFDDGPSTEGGQQILDILRNEGVRATFFVDGVSLEANMPIAQRMVTEGHALGNHSYSHSRMVARSYAFVRLEIALTDALIRANRHTITNLICRKRCQTA